MPATPVRRAGWPSCWNRTRRRASASRRWRPARRRASRRRIPSRSARTSRSVRRRRRYSSTSTSRRYSDGALTMEEAAYSYGGAAKILDIAESKLRYWAQVGFVGPSGRRGGKPVFSFQDLVSVKAAKELVDRGFKAAEIRKALDGVRASLPHLDRPLDRMRVAFDGTRLVVVDDQSAFEPNGQKVFDFDLAELAGKLGYTPAQNGAAEARPARAAVPLPEPPRPETPKPKATFTAARSAYDWFVEGTRAEAAGGGEGDARAEVCYREALALDPGLAAARTNLGSLAYRAGDTTAARDAFEAALALDPDQ